MFDYEGMSDFEVNKAVSSLVDFGDLVVTINNDNEVVYLCDKDGFFDMVPISHFDPCNNPSDAWPIIQQIWVGLMSPPYRGYGTLWDNTVVRYNCGKLRAAMICFLKMKDAEK